MEDFLLKQAQARGLADERGLYLAANVFADEKQLGRVWTFLNGTKLFLAELELPAGVGRDLGMIELSGAKAEVKRFLIPLSLTLETGRGCFTFQGFRDAKRWISAVLAAVEQ